MPITAAYVDPAYLILQVGAPLAQWVKPWPIDLAGLVRAYSRRNLLIRKWGSIAHSL